MSKKPVNLTLNERVLDLAQQIMEPLGHSSLSGFVEQLIRDEYERRSGPMVMQEKPTKPTKPVKYPLAKRKRHPNYQGIPPGQTNEQ